MSPSENDFQAYLNKHEKLIKSVIRSIGCHIKEDIEDLTIEGQKTLWMLFQSAKKDESNSYIKAVIHGKMIDYLRETLPLSRTHMKAIKNGECRRPVVVSDEGLKLFPSNDNSEVIDECIDITLFIESDFFQDHHRALLKLLLENKTDQEIIRALGIKESSLQVYKWEIRRIFLLKYSNL